MKKRKRINHHQKEPFQLEEALSSFAFCCYFTGLSFAASQKAAAIEAMTVRMGA